MKVSVVVPLFNKAPFVRRALESIQRQTHADFEVIVVDDGSTDDGGKVVEAFPDSRFRLVRQANAGPGPARNLGLREAKGELIAFLDADDEWLPGYLENSVRLLESYGPRVACVASGYFLGAQSTVPLWRSRGLEPKLYALQPDTKAILTMHLLALMTPCSTLARTDVVRRWGGFYSRRRCLYAEDAHLWLKVLLNETVAVYLGEPLVVVHPEASALSHNLAGARPIEPFLEDPSDVEASCPEPLRPLLAGVLAIRAAKTAGILTYWSRWREARVLLARFCPWSAWRLPYVACARLGANPLGAGLCHLLRIVWALSPKR